MLTVLRAKAELVPHPGDADLEIETAEVSPRTAARRTEAQTEVQRRKLVDDLQEAMNASPPWSRPRSPACSAGQKAQDAEDAQGLKNSKPLLDGATIKPLLGSSERQGNWRRRS